MPKKAQHCTSNAGSATYKREKCQRQFIEHLTQKRPWWSRLPFVSVREENRRAHRLDNDMAAIWALGESEALAFLERVETEYSELGQTRPQALRHVIGHYRPRGNARLQAPLESERAAGTISRSCFEEREVTLIEHGEAYYRMENYEATIHFCTLALRHEEALNAQVSARARVLRGNALAKTGQDQMALYDYSVAVGSRALCPATTMHVREAVQDLALKNDARARHLTAARLLLLDASPAQASPSRGTGSAFHGIVSR